MILNLSEKNPALLLSNLYAVLQNGSHESTLELVGPGIMLHDTALMLFEVIRQRPTHISLHVHSHTCLRDGAILLWLAADTRSLRSDAWIELSTVPEPPAIPQKNSHFDYKNVIPTENEYPSDTDLRTIMRHLGEWLPIHEISGLRLFESELKELGIMEDIDHEKNLVSLFRN
jgi:hypothetical protein